MKSVKAYYNQIFKERFLPLGFEKKGTLFLRKSGDVIQRFQFFKSSYGPLCSVEFGFLPMCMPEDFPLDGCTFRLDEIANCYSYWRYDPGLPESMENCARLMANVFAKEILPFFDRCTDCSSLIVEEEKLHSKQAEHRLSILREKGLTDCATPMEWWQVSSFSYYAAIKSKNYGYIRRFLEYHVQQKCWRKEYLQVLEQHLCWLNSNNFEAFDLLVQENERKMKERIFEFSPKIAKKWFPEL